MRNGRLELFGLKTCDTCRKARRALDAAGYDVSFTDIRDTPIDPAQLEIWLAEFGPTLLNTRSTTWRGLEEATKQQAPLELLATYPALMKRPLIEHDGVLYLGWSKAVQGELL
ncbi:MAG: ArsC/Spx/MgsR family protein [Pseudomonadota bacterium]